MRDIHLYCEKPPGWAVYPLTSDLAKQFRYSGLNPVWHYWNDDRSISDFEAYCRDHEVSVYAANAVAAEDLGKTLGIPRQNISFCFHSRIEMARFYVWAGQDRRWTKEDEDNFEPNDEFFSLCNRFRAVGFLNHRHGALLDGVLHKTHTPQYVDACRFKPFRPRVNQTIRVGVAFSVLHHRNGVKGEDILSEVVTGIRNLPGITFDSRALHTGEGTGLPYNSMPQFYNDLDVFLCTSREEGGPLTPLQAGACGVPTISSDCGHMKEFIVEGETGFVVENKPSDFLDRLRFLSENRSKLRAMSAQVRKHVVARWSVESAYPRWLALIDPRL